MRSAPAIRHVMFDADGVLQDLPGGWIAAAEPFFGERTLEFLERSYEAHLPTLAGQGEQMTILAAILTDFEVTLPVADVYRGIWLGIEPVAASFAIVRALRGRGYGVHLGTNQESYRTAHMREMLGYDALFDVCCYSCELGAAKPDVAFFTEAAKRIGADPPTILFIDLFFTSKELPTGCPLVVSVTTRTLPSSWPKNSRVSAELLPAWRLFPW